MPRDRTSRRRVLATCAAVFGTAVAGCTDGSGGDDDPAGGADGGGMGDAPGGVDAVVTVGRNGTPGFDPEQVEVQPGATVQWVWASDDHTVTPEAVPTGAEWDGEPESRDEGHTYQNTFDDVGVYQYVCDAHTESDTGVLHVRQQPDPGGA